MIQEWKVNGQRMNFSQEALDALTSNPFKFPRPQGSPGHIEIEGGKKIPGIGFCESMEYLYNFCLQHLTKQFLNTLETAFRNSKVPAYKRIEEMPCGDHVASKLMHVHFWDMQCALICIRQDLTYNDASLMFASIDNLSEYFVMEIATATLRPRQNNIQHRQEESLPKGYSKKSLDRNGGKTRN